MCTLSALDSQIVYTLGLGCVGVGAELDQAVLEQGVCCLLLLLLPTL